MKPPERSYFQLQQAVEIAEAFSKHEVEFMFIGKSGAILLGYPSTTQDVDLFPRKDSENGERIVRALHELDFEITDEIRTNIVDGVDFVQLKTGWCLRRMESIVLTKLKNEC